MLGVTLEGKKEIIAIWIRENESSKYWLIRDIYKKMCPTVTLLIKIPPRKILN